MVALILLRVYFGHEWPFPRFVGLGLLFVSLAGLVKTELTPNYPRGLKRQAVLSSVWGSVVGLWLYTAFLGDLGLIILVAAAPTLWGLSHAEVVKLQAELAQQVDHKAKPSV